MIYRRAFEFGEMGYASAMSVLLFFIVLTDFRDPVARLRPVDDGLGADSMRTGIFAPTGIFVFLALFAVLAIYPIFYMASRQLEDATSSSSAIRSRCRTTSPTSTITARSGFVSTSRGSS